MNGRTNAEDMAARMEREILSIRMGVVELRDRGMEIAARFLEQSLDAKLGVDSRQEATPAPSLRVRCSVPNAVIEPPQWPCQFCGKFVDCCSCCFRWISVKERLPENRELCWVWWDGLDLPFSATRDKRAIGGWRDGDEWEDFAKNVTHWMPLPVPLPPPSCEQPRASATSLRVRCWISVSERLPEWGVPVIGWFPDAARPFECKLNEHDGVWSDCETGIHLHEHSRPSHWMPMPTPPEEKKP